MCICKKLLILTLLCLSLSPSAMAGAGAPTTDYNKRVKLMMELKINIMEGVAKGWHAQCSEIACKTGLVDANGSLMRCGACKLAVYCSRECQRKDWPRHKPDCTPPPPAKAEPKKAKKPEEKKKQVSQFVTPFDIVTLFPDLLPTALACIQMNRNAEWYFGTDVALVYSSSSPVKQDESLPMVRKGVLFSGASVPDTFARGWMEYLPAGKDAINSMFDSPVVV